MKPTRQKCESPGWQSEAISEHSLNDCDYPIQHGACKALLTAKFAEAGYFVYEDCSGDFLVIRTDWELVRHVCTLSSLRAIGCRLGVRHE